MNLPATLEDVPEVTEFWEPPNPITGKVKRKIEKAAWVTAQMTHELWDWGDRKPPRHMDGTLRAPICDVLGASGWSRNSHEARKYLRTRYFNERLKLEERRLNGGFQKALAELTSDGKALDNLGGDLWQSLMDDLADPERRKRIPFKDRAKLYVDITNLNAKLKGQSPEQPGDARTPSMGDEVLDLMKERMDEVTFREMAVKLRGKLDTQEEAIEGTIVAAGED